MASRRKPSKADTATTPLAGANVAPVGFFGRLIKTVKRLVKRA